MRLTGTALQRTAAFQGGDWIDGTQTLAVEDPATGDLLARVADCSRTDAALAAAAQPGWAALTVKERAAILRRRHDLALILTQGVDKTWGSSSSLRPMLR
jgi:succinate-semialdehyde dehydrogenase/glutarate-semialdehyde dehydrogenase